MRLQALRKEGVELQSNAEAEAEDMRFTRDGYGGFDVQSRVEADERDEERKDDLVAGEEESGEQEDGQKDVEPVDKMNVDDSTSHVDNKLRNTGLRTVQSLVNGGLTMFALGALSPVGLLLKHLDGLKAERAKEEELTEVEDE